MRVHKPVAFPIWRKFRHNLDARVKDIPSITIENLLNLHLEEVHTSRLTRRRRFNAWKYLYDLVHFGPEYFQKKQLGDPQVIDGIPITKTSQVPLQGVDVSPSTPGQNAEALDAFFQQAAIGDPNDNPGVKAVGNSVILVSGDLLTIQHLQSLRESRAEESTPWRQVQFPIFIMGLFHFKMACADAIWRVFMNNKASQPDNNDLITFVGQIRPKETRKIASKPGFRCMHEVIQHMGIVSRLDIWWLVGTSRATLEEFAQSEPKWEDIEEMAHRIVVRNGTQSDFSWMRAKDDKERDKVHENMILQEECFLLYKEISHALNYGDIGRVETCFLPWMYIFAGCGKHKYASELRRYLEDIHFNYPKPLRCVRI